VVTSRPDGHILLGVTPTYLQTPLLGKTARSYRDTTAVARVFIDPMILYVKYDSPYKSAKEIIEDAKKNPGKQRWGGATRFRRAHDRSSDPESGQDRGCSRHLRGGELR
jgi:putative tricarboxylic transport membrane protein